MTEPMKPLKYQFEGRGEVKGYTFTRVMSNPRGYLYEVKDTTSGELHYEVFKRKENKQFNMVSYPGAKSFGKWAWSYKDFNLALVQYKRL